MDRYIDTRKYFRAKVIAVITAIALVVSVVGIGAYMGAHANDAFADCTLEQHTHSVEAGCYEVIKIEDPEHVDLNKVEQKLICTKTVHTHGDGKCVIPPKEEELVVKAAETPSENLNEIINEEEVIGLATQAEETSAEGLITTADQLNDAIATDGTYVLGADIAANITIPAGKNITLDLNGKTLSSASEHTSIITVKGALILEDKAGNGKITGANEASQGGGVKVDSGTLIMKSGNISSNSAVNGGGVYVGGSSAVFAMEGGLIEENHAATYSGGYRAGGGVYVNNGARFIMSGGTIARNYADSIYNPNGGGGVYVNGAKATFEMTGGSIEDNFAIKSGGGICVGNEATFTMSGGKIRKNKTQENGGGVQFQSKNSTFAMLGGEISENEASNGNGGGVNVEYGSATFTMSANTASGSKGTITGNSAKRGGGVYLTKGTTNLNDGAIYNNTALDAGADLYKAGGTFNVNVNPAGKGWKFDYATSGGQVKEVTADAWFFDGGSSRPRWNAPEGSDSFYLEKWQPGAALADGTGLKAACTPRDASFYEVNYDYNNDKAADGVNKNMPENYSDQNASYTIGEQIPVYYDGDKANEFVLFMGWSPTQHGVYTAEDNKLPDTLYEAKQEITLTNEPLTLYAVWALDSDGDGIPDVNEKDAWNVRDVADGSALKEAIATLNRASGEFIINLTSDIDFDSDTPAITCTISLYGNGHTINYSGAKGGLKVDGGTLNLGTTAGGDANALTIKGARGFSAATLTSGTLNMYDGVKITDNYAKYANGTSTGVGTPYGGGVYVNSGTFNMYGGEISGNYAYFATSNWSENAYGSGVYVKSGAFTMSGGEIKDNCANANGVVGRGNNYGGGVSVAGGTFTMEGGSINNNNAPSREGKAGLGGGVHVAAGATLGGISNSTISGNQAAYGGGGVYVENINKNSLSISNVTISNNEITETSNGSTLAGGVYLNNGNCTMDNVTISGNYGGNSGGGIYAKAVNLTISNSAISSGNVSDEVFKGNKASNGGGITVGSNSTLTLNNTEISGNTATSNGGGVYAAGNSTVIMNENSKMGEAEVTVAKSVKQDDGTWTMQSVNEPQGNKASGSGGSVYVESGTLKMNSNAVITKSNAVSGAGAYMNNSTLEMNDSALITACKATSDGGAVYANNSTVLLYGEASIVNNTAKNGAGVYGSRITFTMNGTASDDTASITGNKASVSGGGVYVNSGTLTMNVGNLYNNTAKTSGDDIYNISGSLTLVNPVKTSWTLPGKDANGNNANVSVDGWYYDGAGCNDSNHVENGRWDVSENQNQHVHKAGTLDESETTVTITGEAALKAAYPADKIIYKLVYSTDDINETFKTVYDTEATKKLEETAPTYAGEARNMVFLGWSLNKSINVITIDNAATASETIAGLYAPGAEVTLTSDNPSATVYAVWGYDTDGDDLIDALEPAEAADVDSIEYGAHYYNVAEIGDADAGTAVVTAEDSDTSVGAGGEVSNPTEGEDITIGDNPNNPGTEGESSEAPALGISNDQFKDAIASLNAGNNIIAISLTGNTAISGEGEDFTIAKDKKLALLGNGNSIVYNDANVTGLSAKDGNLAGITVDGGDLTLGRATDADEPANELTITGARGTSGILVKAGNLTMEDGVTITGNVAKYGYKSVGNPGGNNGEGYGGGVNVQGGTFTMNGGTIKDNRAAQCVSTSGVAYGITPGFGGGVYVKSGANFVMNKGDISSNVAYYTDRNTKSWTVLPPSPLAYNRDESTWGDPKLGYTPYEDGKIIDGFGGGVCVDQGGTFTMNGGTINENMGTESMWSDINGFGGGVYVAGEFNASGATISRNIGAYCDREGWDGCISWGGGIHVAPGGSLDMTGSTISGNKTSDAAADQTDGWPPVGIPGGNGDNGGGIFMSGGTATLNGVTINGNLTKVSGAGVYVGKSASLTMNGGTLNGNECDSAGYLEGGGAAFVNGTMNVEGTTINKNKVGGNFSSGGAVYVTRNGSFDMTGGTIDGNADGSDKSTSCGGGAIFVGANQDGAVGLLSLTNVQVKDNYSGTQGGGVCMLGGVFTMTDETGEISNNAAALRGDDIYKTANATIVDLIPTPVEPKELWQLDENHGGPHAIEGWFYDGAGCTESTCISPSARWSATKDSTLHAHVMSLASDANGLDGEVAIKAAYEPRFIVTYTDGVEPADGEEDIVIFPDQTRNDLKYGAATPAFEAVEGVTTVVDDKVVPTRTGYVFMGWDPVVAETVTGDATYKATWLEDKIGNNPDPNDPSIEYSDGIPDIYQLVVTYEAVHGTIVGKPQVVLDKLNEQGEYAEDGIAIIKELKQAQPDEGYDPMSGKWAPYIPGAGTKLTENATFVITFEKTEVPNPPEEPNTPDNPDDPEDPDTPDNPKDPDNPEGPENPGTPENPSNPQNPNNPGNTPDNNPGGNPQVNTPGPLTETTATAATVADEPIPFAPADENLNDSDNPLAAWGDGIDCWVHRLMILGIIITLIYGVGVILRRRVDIHELDKTQDDPKDQDPTPAPIYVRQTHGA